MKAAAVVVLLLGLAGEAAAQSVQPPPSVPGNAIASGIGTCFSALSFGSTTFAQPAVFCPQTTQYLVPFSAFASSEALAQVQQQMQGMNGELSRGVAMASALDFQRPSPGQSNRAAAGIAEFNGESAIALSYTRQQGRTDFSAGLATSGGKSMAKAALGFSW